MDFLKFLLAKDNFQTTSTVYANAPKAHWRRSDNYTILCEDPFLSSPYLTLGVGSMLHRSLKWLLVLLITLPLLAMLYIAIFGWNWARTPLQRIVTQKTGRALVIAGDLNVQLAWPAPRIRARGVSFANPPWAKEKQMLAVEDVEFTVELPGLFKKNLMFPEVRLTHPVVFLEQAADGRKTWLLDFPSLAVLLKSW